MIAPAEKERLLRDFHREPVWGLGAVLKCASCLLILMGICVIGTSTNTQQTDDGTRASSAVTQQRAALGESRNGF